MRFRAPSLGIAPLLVAALLLLTTSCNNSKLWGQTRDELFAHLESREYGFFDGIETSRYEQVLKLGVEAPFYFGLHLSAAGKSAEAREMFNVGFRKSPDPFKLLCLEELTRIGTPEERLDAVDLLVSLNKTLNPSDIRALEFLRIKLLIELGRTDKIPSGISTWQIDIPLDENFVTLFPTLPTNPDTSSYGIMDARIALFSKNYGSAWIRAKAFLEAGVTEAYGRTVLSDFGKAALYGSADYPLDAAFLDRLFAETDNPDARFFFSFYAGRLYERASGIFAANAMRMKARERFIVAMSFAVTDTDYDSALWYLLDLSRERSVDDLFADLERYAGTWKNAAWFTDQLDVLIVRLVDNRDWARIARLRLILGKQSDSGVLADREIRTRLEYITARSGKLSDADTTVAYETTFASDHRSLYYRSLAADALDRSLGSPNPFQAKQLKSDKAPPTEDATSFEVAHILRGYITYFLPEKLYSAAVDLYPAIPVSLATELSKSLSATGRYADAIRLVLLALRSSDRSITDEELVLLYPRPWLAEVSAAAKQFNIPEYLLYALIRSESYFQSDVRSGAGAVGLSQLMPSTAVDIARKLKMKDSDLLDPGTNITFGAYYLSEMIRRLDGHVLPALFAYNAGITRVRQWQKTAAGLPDDLFLETLPYTETREYGRKVLAAAVVYGYLYYQKTTGQVVRDIF